MTFDSVTTVTPQERAVLRVIEQHRAKSFSRDGVSCFCRPNPPYQLMLSWEKHREHLAEALIVSGVVKDSCICNTGPDTEGPDECCPVHGRPLAYWIEYGDAMQLKVEKMQKASREAKARLQAARDGDPDELVQAITEAMELLEKSERPSEP